MQLTSNVLTIEGSVDSVNSLATWLMCYTHTFSTKILLNLFSVSFFFWKQFGWELSRFRRCRVFRIIDVERRVCQLRNLRLVFFIRWLRIAYLDNKVATCMGGSFKFNGRSCVRRVLVRAYAEEINSSGVQASVLISGFLDRGVLRIAYVGRNVLGVISFYIRLYIFGNFQRVLSAGRLADPT